MSVTVGTVVGWGRRPDVEGSATVRRHDNTDDRTRSLVQMVTVTVTVTGTLRETDRVGYSQPRSPDVCGTGEVT